MAGHDDRGQLLIQGKSARHADQATAARLASSLACRDALLERGVDLGSYSSDASAADLVTLEAELVDDAAGRITRRVPKHASGIQGSSRLVAT